MLEVLLKFLAILIMLTLSPFALGIAYAEGDSLTRNISAFYSDIDMQMSLATKQNATACVDQECLEHKAFDERVHTLGAKLVTAAYAVYPELQKRTPSFHFDIVDKVNAATASTANGRIIVFRGLQQLALGDEALSYVLAREMGHVIGQHHTQNITTKLMISAIASIIFPALAIVSASSTAAQASTATSLITSAASSVTSFVGSEVAIKKAKPNQLAQSDNIALNLMLYQAYDIQIVLEDIPVDDASDTAWLNDLQLSAVNLESAMHEQTMDLAAAPI
ncbi:MAG: M48 family metalloprotease [Methylophilus sp.]|nr:M48 family metalloprotease [Methylophilus sp.]